MNEEITPIHDDKCEELVLGTLISIRSSSENIGSSLDEGCFYSKKNKEIFKSIKSIIDRGDSCDIVTMMAELSKNGINIQPYELAELATNTTFDIHQHIRRLRELSIRRLLYEKSFKMLENGISEKEDLSDVVNALDVFTKDIFDIGFQTSKTTIDYINEAIMDIHENLKNKGSSGTHTGFNEIDDIGGLQKSDLILIAGASSQGKTSLADSICVNALKSGANIAFYSLEMKASQIMKRFAAIESGVNARRIMYSPLMDEELIAVDKAFGTLADLHVYFDDKSTSSLDNIIYSIRSQKAKNGINGAIIDYIQIISMGGKKDSEEQKLGECARRLKNLAKELDIWIIVLSQLNRDRESPEPTVDRLRGSGQINEAADVTMLVYRADYYGKSYSGDFSQFETRGTMQIHVAKGRNIGTFRFLAGFDSGTTKVYNLTTYPKVEKLGAKKDMKSDDSVTPF